jgi:hypothetical protein
MGRSCSTNVGGMEYVNYIGGNRERKILSTRPRCKWWIILKWIVRARMV